MNKIILLDDDTISKIAAGEVIERPASVVKELVENSIDAGARKISVEVKDGGKKLIMVADDGLGMDSEDTKLAVQRHSTSKIKNADDLFSIKTLGFRGEALASIAGVSRFEILSSADNCASGTKLIIEGGSIKKQTSCGHPRGTTITVEELFFNTPARLKFQKGKGTELSHIVDIVSRFILSRPDIAFELKSDDQKLLSSTGSGKLSDSIASVYGSDMAMAMLEVKGAGIHGYTTQPVVTKSDRYGESFFVNGRFVRNALLSRALENAYSSLIPGGKYPIAAIFIDIDPAEIDVNVHPTKREIKFSKPDSAMKAISAAVAEALSRVSVAADNLSIPSNWTVDRFSNEKLQISEGLPEMGSYEGSGSQGRALLQYSLTYIIAVEGEDLIMVDQHAAHERIMYERIKNNNDHGIQSMLVPKSVELDPIDFNLIVSNLEDIKDIGFEIEPFGKNTIMVRGIPAVLGTQNIDEALSDMLSELSSSFKIKSVDERKDAIWKMMACKAAVKAGDKLSYHEMNDLIDQLLATSNPTTCPHGRPTLVKISRQEMEKLFKR